MLDPDVLAPERVRPLLVREYEALIEAGVFGRSDRIELLRGVLVEMSPQGDPHAAISAYLVQVLSKALPFEPYDVRGHSPYAATEDSMPEPDVFVSKRGGGRPSRAMLVIEVSDSSLRKDRIIKTQIYAENGVPEYWIVNVQAQQIEVLTSPHESDYRNRAIISSGVLRPTKLPDVEIEVDYIPWTGVFRAKRSS